MVSLSEGNEARRNGRQGVAAPQSTVEAGEPTRREIRCRFIILARKEEPTPDYAKKKPTSDYSDTNEGGYFRVTYRAFGSIPVSLLPAWLSARGDAFLGGAPGLLNGRPNSLRDKEVRNRSPFPEPFEHFRVTSAIQ